MLGWMNCQSASPATPSLPISSGQFEDGGVFEEMAVEMPDFVLTKCTACRHRLKKVFKNFGEVQRIIDASLKMLVTTWLGRSAVVFGEEAEEMRITKRAMRRIFVARPQAHDAILHRKSIRRTRAQAMSKRLHTKAARVFTVTSSVVRCGLRKFGSVKAARSRCSTAGVSMFAFVNSCVSCTVPLKFVRTM